MACCQGIHDAEKIRASLVTIDQEPKRDDSTEPPTYTFPVGAITEIAGRPVGALDQQAGKQLGIAACVVAICGALIGAGIMWLVKD